MTELKDNLNDTKFLLEETDYKNTNNNSEESNLKNALLNNTQLLLEDKSSIIYDISNDNININQEKKENNYNINKKEEKFEQENSIKDILIKNNNKLNINEEKEKMKDEQEIIRQQNILLNNQSSHLDELLSLSYHHNNIIQNKNNINKYIKNNINNNQIYFGVLFPTEKTIKNICYKNDDKKKIICFNITKSKNDNSNDEQYFKILIDNNKNYFNLKSNEEINVKILLEVPFIKHKKQLKCDIQVIDINNNLIDTFHLYANIEIPKLCCMKYKNKNTNFNSKEYNTPLIQIKLNLNDNDINNIHKFRIPLKNLSIKDLNINFNFISNPKENDINKFIDYEIFFENDKNIVFPSLDINYIELLLNINFKTDINKDNNNIKIKKIIEANINGTKINYYFCLEILIGYFNNDLNII